ncbi:hypothetical protein LOTGIDRAFT_159171 [Lottia gigantea]|uniref:Phospholipase A2 domain-containing protein n=1 Tax=Lottia gigantea TaxID=225164 RepID=V4AXQ6_LOTGI|nr:hypothetical protein LOTGIDRAFT_159171 [Lottia gigantea]ESO98366.1 hypothetical protein LOTGIDRAFT_159171 [Lottia gigantea]
MANNGDINGCSIPFVLPLPFKQRFTPSSYTMSVIHVKRNSISRSRCDAKFLTDMENACREKINRKGAALGISKTTCDDKFYNEMNQECKNVSRKDVGRKNLGSLFCQMFSGSYYGMSIRGLCYYRLRIVLLQFFDSSTRMRLSLVFGVCIVAGLVGLVTAQCNRNGDINGCSIPFGLPLPFKQKFTPSCYKHDVCYFCGAARDISRLRCDAKFLTDMENACREIRNSKDREKCSKWANRYKGACQAKNIAMRGPYELKGDINLWLLVAPFQLLRKMSVVLVIIEFLTLYGVTITNAAQKAFEIAM